MINRKSISVYGIHLSIEFEGEKFGELIDRLTKNLSAVIQNSVRLKKAASISLKLLLSGKISIPKGSRLLSPEYALFKVLNWRGMIYLVYGDSVLQLDLQTGTAIGYFDEAIFKKPRPVCYSFLDSSIRILLHSQGLFYLHAAALERQNIGYLFVAESGAGKTTNALHLVEKGWNYLSDDSVFLQGNGNKKIILHSIPSEFRLNGINENSRKHLLKHSFTVPNNDKHFIRMEKAYPAQYRKHCAPHIIIFPKIVNDGVSRFVPVGKIKALGLLMNESPLIFAKYHQNNNHLEVLKNLINQCVTYRLLAGRDLLHNPDKLFDLISSVPTTICENSK